MTILSINSTDVSKITSGQVIIDLVSVVKELVDNSIDANSDKIEITFASHGAERVEVADNGSGIDPADFEALCLKYHTSKLSTFEELSSVTTLGFRGEAMSSMCSLARVKVTTCSEATFPRAAALEYDAMGALVAKKTSVSGKKGTTVTVSDLFYSLPVRQKNFVKHSKREYSKALSLLMAYLLAYPNIRFTIFNISANTGKKAMVLATQGGKATTTDALVNVYGSNGGYGLVPIDISVQDIDHRFDLRNVPGSVSIQMSGYISDYSFGMGRAATDRQFLSINKRPVSHKRLTKVINEVYKAYNTTQSPVFVIDIELDTSFVDVNVTPDKRQVMVQCEDVICEVVREELTRFYDGRHNVIPKSEIGIVNVGEESLFVSEDEPVEKQSTHRSQSQNRRPTRGPSLQERFGAERENGGDTRELEDFTVSESVEATIAEELDTSEANAHEDDQDSFSDQDIATNRSEKDHGISDLDEEESDDEVQEEPEAQYPIADEGQEAAELSDEDEEPPINVSAEPIEIEEQSDDEGHETDLGKETNVTLLGQDDVEADAPVDTFEDLDSDAFGDMDETSTQAKNEKAIRQSPSKSSQPALYGEASRPPPLRPGHRSELHSLRSTLEFSMANLKLEVPDSEDGNARLASVHDITEAMEIRKADFSHMEVVGQFNSGFIIVTHRGRLFIVDQHALDEIYNYEQLMRTLVLRAQPLVVPRMLELSPIDEMVILEHMTQLRKNGFVVEADDDAVPGRKVRLVAVPVSKNVVFDDSDLHELVHKLHELGGAARANSSVRCTKVDRMIALRACRLSIMVGLALTHNTMSSVLRHMSALDKPWNCPHGRPTMRHLADLRGRGFAADYEL